MIILLGCVSVVFDIFTIWYIYDLFSGDTLGYSRMRNKEEYFIYDSFEMWYYAVHNIGFMFVVGMIFLILMSLATFILINETIKKYFLRG